MSRPDELELLEADIRASAPHMSPELERRLAAIVDRPARPPWRARVWRPAVATAMAAALIAVVVLGIARSGGGPASDDSASSGGRAAAPEVSRQATPGAASPATPSPVPQGARRVERDNALTLATPTRSFDDVTDGVVQTADRFRGIVQNSNVEEQSGAGRASFDLRIPVARLDETLAALSRLAHVRSRSAGSVDVTGAFAGAQSRLADARTERRALLKALAAAKTAQEIASVRARLRDARLREARARRTVERLRARTDFARVSVTVETTRGGTTAAGPGNHRWTPADAARDALRVLEVAVGVALVALAVLVPFALLGGAAIGGTRVARRRRREAALSG